MGRKFSLNADSLSAVSRAFAPFPDDDQDGPNGGGGGQAQGRDDSAQGQQDDRSDRRDERDDDLGDKGKNALDAERKRARDEGRARKAAEDRAAKVEARLKEIEDAQLSEVDRAKRQADEARAEIAQYKVEALRYRAAARYGIDDADAELFLTASDEDGIRRQAERFAAVVARRKDDGDERRDERADERREPRTPRPDPSQGGRSERVRAGGLSAGADAYRAERQHKTQSFAALTSDT